MQNNQDHHKIIRGCDVTDCSGVHYGLGLCHRHWLQWKKHGTITGNPCNSRLDDNEFIITDNVCRIVLRDTMGTRVGEALVDAEDIDKVIHFKWHLASVGYARTTDPETGKSIYLHKYIINNPKLITDHVNGMRLDCRKLKLRNCSRTENNRHSRKRSRPCSSIYKGVTYDRFRTKWIAQIRCDGKHKHLGRFTTEREAALAYNASAGSIFGQYAWLNDVPSTRKEV